MAQQKQFPPQQQSQRPGQEQTMAPKPEAERQAYKPAGKLLGKKPSSRGQIAALAAPSPCTLPRKVPMWR